MKESGVKNKIMGLDVGTKRIGVALSDVLHILSHPFGVVHRVKESIAVSEIKKIAVEYNITTIVVGLPRNMDGTLGTQAKDCQDFANHFAAEFEIKFEDETLSSFAAENNLRSSKKKYTKQKHLVDIESACIILQQYLDAK